MLSILTGAEPTNTDLLILVDLQVVERVAVKITFAVPVLVNVVWLQLMQLRLAALDGVIDQVTV